MILATEHLLLREFTADDWPAVLEYQRDPRYLRYYAWTDRTAEEVQAFVRKFVEAQEARPRTTFQLALVLPAGGPLIGNCGIRLNAPESRAADVGYELDPRHWGRGYATEAARAIVGFGFAELGLHRIWSWCTAENVASAHVLEKVGMRREGHLRENEWIKGRWRDTLLYAVLDHEWRAQSAPAPARSPQADTRP